MHRSQLIPEEKMDFCGICETFAPTMVVETKSGPKSLCDGCQDRELVIACERCGYVGDYDMQEYGTSNDDGYFCEDCADELGLLEAER